MSGLLAKDLALMKQRGKIMLFLVAWGILMTFIMEDAAFVVGWIVMIAAITSISTISYDEYDNCMPFLMTLPVTRRDYAVEKYLFSAAVGAVFWLIALVIVIVSSLVRGSVFSPAEELPGMVLFLGVLLAILALCIPPQLKWGAEKGRIMMLLIFGVVFVVSLLIGRFGGGLQKAAAFLESLPMAGVILGSMAFSLALTAVSVMISIRIMEKKEF